MIDIETQAMELVVGSLVAVIAYFFVLRRFADIAQPTRLKLAKCGESILLSSPGAERARQIAFYLDNAFSGWVMLFAAIVLPFVALFFVVKKATGRFELTAQSNKEDDRVMLLFTASAFAANPICGSIVAIEAVAIAFLLILIFGTPGVVSAVIEDFIRAEIAILGRKSAPDGSIAA
jgi:hypothetical protein